MLDYDSLHLIALTVQKALLCVWSLWYWLLRITEVRSCSFGWGSHVTPLSAQLVSETTNPSLCMWQELSIFTFFFSNFIHDKHEKTEVRRGWLNSWVHVLLPKPGFRALALPSWLRLLSHGSTLRLCSGLLTQLPSGRSLHLQDSNSFSNLPFTALSSGLGLGSKGMWEAGAAHPAGCSLSSESPEGSLMSLSQSPGLSLLLQSP